MNHQQFDENTSDLQIDEQFEPPIDDLEWLDEEDDDEDFDPSKYVDEDEEDDDRELASSAADPASEPPASEDDRGPPDDDEDEPDLISKRTRSNYKVEAPPIEPLEFPDFSEDLYAPDIEDPVYASFLNGLFADELDPVFAEDDENDPEYSFESDRKLVKSSGNESVSVSQKETELLKEEVDVCNEPDISAWTSSINDSHRLMIRRQMIQHVQLLTQSYLLSTCDKLYEENAAMAKMLLNEVKWKAGNNPSSFFRTPNLDTALQLTVSNDLLPDNDKSPPKRKGKRRLPLPGPVQQAILKHPRAFPCLQLLPTCAYEPPDDCSAKTMYTNAEDFLIALGIDQFRKLNRHLYYVQQLLVPTKTVEQLRIHVKNTRRRPLSSSPLSRYLKKMELPPSVGIPCPLVAREKFDPNAETLPSWMKLRIEPKANMFVAMPKPSEEEHTLEIEYVEVLSSSPSSVDADDATPPKQRSRSSERQPNDENAKQPQVPPAIVQPVPLSSADKQWTKEEDLLLLTTMRKESGLDTQASLVLAAASLGRDLSSILQRINYYAEVSKQRSSP